MACRDDSKIKHFVTYRFVGGGWRCVCGVWQCPEAA